jgi:hypothetical protein
MTGVDLMAGLGEEEGTLRLRCGGVEEKNGD